MVKKLTRIILHMGPDKTGSTAIQKALFNGQDILLKNEIICSSGASDIDQFLIYYFCDIPLLNLGKKNLETNLVQSRDYIKQLKKKIEETTAKELILSYEGLVHLSSIELNKLRRFLLQYSDNIIVVMYAREPLSYAKSAMSHRVKHGRRMLENGEPFLAYKDYLKKLVDVFGKQNINVRRFSQSHFPHGDVVRDFLTIFDMDNQNVTDIANNSNFSGNPSLSHKALLVGDRVIDLLNGDIATGKTFKDLFLPIFSQIGGEKIGLTDKKVSAIRNVAEEHSIYLACEFGIFHEATAKQNSSNEREVSAKEVDVFAREIIRSVLPDYKIPKRYCLLLNLINRTG